MKKPAPTTLLLVVAIIVAACGGASAEAGPFCDDYLNASTLLASGPEDDPEAWSAETSAALEKLKEAPPEEIATAVETISDALIGPVSSLDEEGFNAASESESFQGASAAIETFLASDCGWANVEVTATDYQYNADLDDLQAGVVGFDFQNEGSEFHEMVLVRINDGVEVSVEELLAMPEEESEELTTFVGISFQAPGANGTLYADLEPGRYAFFCFLPVGATPDNMEALESGEFEGGPPHFTEGMVEEFTIS